MSKQRNRAAIYIVIAAAAVILVAAVASWALLRHSPDTASTAHHDETTHHICKSGNERATGGTFCSAHIEISLKVPDMFAGKFTTADGHHYTATISDNGSWEMSIAHLDTDSTDVGINDNLQATTYDAHSQTLKTADGEAVPSLMLDGRKAFRATDNDAGRQTISYLMLGPDHLVRIVLMYAASSAPTGGDNSALILQQFDEYVKSLQVV